MAFIDTISERIEDLFDDIGTEIAREVITFEDAVGRLNQYGLGDEFRDFWADNKDEYVD